MTDKQPPRPPAAANAIEAAGLEKSYGERPVLWNLDLTVPWGQRLALFGENGAGKTTLLRVLSTAVKPDGGAVRIAGHNLRRQPGAVRRAVGVVGHRSFMYDDLTCRENLIYYGRLYGLESPAKRADEALARVGLAPRANQRVRALSNGMQKRAALARSILHRPGLLLLDEPEAGLDAEHRRMLGELLAEWAAAGRSAVFTTHDRALGLAWADAAVTLSGGKLSAADWADAGNPADGHGAAGNREGGNPANGDLAGGNPANANRAGGNPAGGPPDAGVNP